MKLTIFTPTYNRCKLLKRVYESIKKQHTDDIEWLVVDDGSTDDTESYIKELIKEAAFPVTYIKKENGGKHSAHNTAVERARGEWFMCLDSDDTLTEGAVLNILSILPKCTDSISAVAAYKTDVSGKLLCEKFDSDEVVRGIYSLLKKHHGEYVFILRTEIIKRYPFPVFAGERFSSECILYDRLEIDGYAVLPLGEVIQECEYQTEGLTSSYKKLISRNPCGFQMYHAQRIFLAENLRKRFICCIKYCAFRTLGKFKAPKYKGKYAPFIFLAYPLGFLAAIYYKI